MTCIPYIGVPYESVYGAVTRAAYRFPLNHSTLRTSFQCCPGPHTSFYRADLFQGPRSDELGWQRAITEQTDALGTGNSLADHMFAIRLIFCPICLQYGYHSYLFQLFWLPICPLHRCRLTSQCQACGAPTRLFDFEASLLKRPYMCLQCNCPLAGAPINVADMAFFVDHGNDLRRNMGGLNAWCIQAKRSISVLKAVEWNDLMASDESRRFRRLLLAICNEMSPLPSDLTPSSLPAVNVLAWRRPFNTYERRQYYSSTVIRLGSGVYRVVLRRIERALAATSARGAAADQTESRRDAYLLLRRTMEEGNPEYPSCEDQDGKLSTIPKWYHIGGQCSRITWFAYFVGMFSIAQFLVKTRGSRTVWDLVSTLRELAPSALQARDKKGRVTEAMVIPSLEDFDVRPLRPMTSASAGDDANQYDVSDFIGNIGVRSDPPQMDLRKHIFSFATQLRLVQPGPRQ